MDGAAQSVYAWIDYSNTTNGNITTRRYCNKFSSSSTSQVDTSPIISSTYGVSCAWYCITKTDLNSDVDKHRFTMIVETQENL